MNEFLDSQIINKLRDTINETNIFVQDEVEKDKFNLICAIMDRIDTAIYYINSKYDKCPNTEEEFIIYIFYCCNIVETIKNAFEKLNIEKPKGNNYFETVWSKIKNGTEISETYNDDKFFSYFRSLVFAHPTDTSKSIPDRLTGEKQYSPYILLNRNGILENKDMIGVEIYSDKRETFCLTFEFEILNQYIKWKYELLNNIIEEFQNIIKSKEQKWKLHKVNREQDSINVLENIKEILDERYMETDIVEKLITYLNCECSLEENKEAVEKYKMAIINIIPKICDAIDEYNHEAIYDAVRDVLYSRPKAHQMMHYQLEKIYCYLNNEYGDTEWGLIQAEAFANEFAKKWVTIKPRSMSFEEIKMLTSVACYLEYKEQIKE